MYARAIIIEGFHDDKWEAKVPAVELNLMGPRFGDLG